MADDYLSQLEDRWRDTGEAPEEARVLLERIRVGLLTRTRLELAAYLGHEAAGLALPDAGETAPPDDPKRLVTELWRWGKEACVGAAVASARMALAGDVAGDPRAQQAVEAAAGWVKCPCGEHLEAAAVAAQEALAAAGITDVLAPDVTDARLPALAAHHCARAAAAPFVPMSMKHAYRTVKYAQLLVTRAGGSPAAMCSSMSHALVRWALGPGHVP